MCEYSAWPKKSHSLIFHWAGFNIHCFMFHISKSFCNVTFIFVYHCTALAFSPRSWKSRSTVESSLQHIPKILNGAKAWNRWGPIQDDGSLNNNNQRARRLDGRQQIVICRIMTDCPPEYTATAFDQLSMWLINEDCISCWLYYLFHWCFITSHLCKLDLLQQVQISSVYL